MKNPFQVTEDEESNPLKATRCYDWPPFSREYESVDCNVKR